MATRPFDDLKKAPKQIETVREWAQDIMNFIFERSQQNLADPMTWGDSRHPSERRPTKIWDTGYLAGSALPPFWKDDNTITLNYEAPHAVDVEYGSEPKNININVLQSWVRRKLGKGEKASWAMAHNIQKKIAQEGIPPHPFIRNSIHSAIVKYNLTIKGPEL